jgi:hypothetical protein
VIKKGWGEECNCLRCIEESDPVNWKKFGLSEDLVDYMRAEKAFMAWANNKFAPAICKYMNLSFETFLQNDQIESVMNNESIEWKGLQWREFYVLEFYHTMVRRVITDPKLLGTFSQSFLLSKNNRISRVFDHLIYLYRLKMTVCNEGSASLYETRDTMIFWLTLCQSLQISIKYSGFDCEKSIAAKIKDLTHINKITKSI